MEYANDDILKHTEAQLPCSIQEMQEDNTKAKHSNAQLSAARNNCTNASGGSEGETIIETPPLESRKRIRCHLPAVMDKKRLSSMLNHSAVGNEGNTRNNINTDHATVVGGGKNPKQRFNPKRNISTRKDSFGVSATDELYQEQDKNTKKAISNIFSQVEYCLQWKFKDIKPLIGVLAHPTMNVINISRDNEPSSRIYSEEIDNTWMVKIIEGEIEEVKPFFFGKDRMPIELALFLVERDLMKIQKHHVIPCETQDCNIKESIQSKYKEVDIESRQPSTDQHTNEYYSFPELQFFLVVHCHLNIDLYVVYSHLLKAGYVARKRSNLFNFPKGKLGITFDAWIYPQEGNINLEGVNPDLSVYITGYYGHFPTMKQCHQLFQHESQPIYFCMVDSGMMNFMLLKEIDPKPTLKNDTMKEGSS